MSGDGDKKGGGKGHPVKGRNIAKQWRAIFAKGHIRKGKDGKGKYSRTAGSIGERLRAVGARTGAQRGGATRHNHNTSAVNRAGKGLNRPVIGASGAHLRGSGTGGKVDHSATRAARVKAGLTVAANFVTRPPGAVDRRLAARAPSYGRSRTVGGRVQAAFATRVGASHLETAGAQAVRLPGAGARKWGEAPGQRGTLFRNLRAEGGTAYKAQTDGPRLLRQIRQAQRATYDTPGLDAQGQKRRYAALKRREERVRRLIDKFGAKS